VTAVAGTTRSVRVRGRSATGIGTWLALVLVALGVVAAPAQAADPVVAAAGDIACDPGDQYYNSGSGDASHCRQRYTSNLLVNQGDAAVLPLGDNQYDNATLAKYQTSYNPSWGRVKSITRPVPGNHEPGNATGYFDYFNGSGVASGPAGQRGKGYYSYDVGAWHLIALNSNCSAVPCSSGSAQERWLRADLAAHQNLCTLAYWHHPRFSSGHDGNNTFMQPIWQDLFNAGAELVLSGHSHDYERFAPQNASGKLDRTNGIRQFVVGTGGAFFTGISTKKPNSELRQNSTYGVLRLTLAAGSYTWKFIPESGKSFTDSGTAPCHGSGTTPSPPPAPPSPSPSPTPAVVNPRTGALDGPNGVKCTITGSDAGELLVGTSGDDVICALGGNDRIRAGRGNDVIFGGDGNDLLLGGKGRDRLYGNAGRDRLRGQSGRDRLVGGPGRDRLYGNAGRDSLSGRDAKGGDHLFGGSGWDRASADRGDRLRSVEHVFFLASG
jgi:acid phosphatase type 7